MNTVIAGVRTVSKPSINFNSGTARTKTSAVQSVIYNYEHDHTLIYQDGDMSQHEHAHNNNNNNNNRPDIHKLIEYLRSKTRPNSTEYNDNKTYCSPSIYKKGLRYCRSCQLVLSPDQFWYSPTDPRHCSRCPDCHIQLRGRPYKSADSTLRHRMKYQQQHRPTSPSTGNRSGINK